MRNGLEQLKLETAAELGILNYDQVDKGLLPSRVNGMVGGMMVRKMINLAESVLAGQELLDAEGKNLALSNSVTDGDRMRVQQAFTGMKMLQDSLPPAHQVDQAQQLEQLRLH